MTALSARLSQVSANVTLQTKKSHPPNNHSFSAQRNRLRDPNADTKPMST